jgi:hypothetical protein
MKLYKGYEIKKLEFNGEKWYTVFKDGVRQNEGRDLRTLTQAKMWVDTLH